MDFSLKNVNNATGIILIPEGKNTMYLEISTSEYEFK